jgi:hypothetical protein
MFDRMCGDVPIPEPDPEHWQEQIKQLARDRYAAMVAHGDLARAALATIPSGPNAMRVSNAMLGIMLSGGLPPQVASWALDRIFLYIVADAYESSLYRARIGASEQDIAAYFDVFTEQLAAYYEALPADRYPHLRKHARDLVSGDGMQRSSSASTCSSMDWPGTWQGRAGALSAFGRRTTRISDAYRSAGLARETNGRY